MKLKIVQQGQAIINADNIHINYQNDNVVLAEIDMRSKWCEIGYVETSEDGYLGFGIAKTERSTQLSKRYSDDDPDTEVQITDFDSRLWCIFNITCNRYTIKIVLLKK